MNWLIALLILFILISIGFFTAWLIEYLKASKNYTAPFGLLSYQDGNPISRCGTSGNQQCVYNMSSLFAAEQQCELLKEICEAFVFNPDTLTMKIVNPQQTFTSGSGYLFIRQNNS